MSEQNEGGSTIEWRVRDPDVIATGYWDDDGQWDDLRLWEDGPLWTDVATGDRTD